jgi:hypothetical protein
MLLSIGAFGGAWVVHNACKLVLRCVPWCTLMLASALLPLKHLNPFKWPYLEASRSFSAHLPPCAWGTGDTSKWTQWEGLWACKWCIRASEMLQGWWGVLGHANCLSLPYAELYCGIFSHILSNSGGSRVAKMSGKWVCVVGWRWDPGCLDACEGSQGWLPAWVPVWCDVCACTVINWGILWKILMWRRSGSWKEIWVVGRAWSEIVGLSDIVRGAATLGHTPKGWKTSL